MNTINSWTTIALLFACGAALSSESDTAMAFAADDPSLAWSPCPDFMPAGCEIAVLHGDPAGPASDIFFKVPAGARIPHHRHTGAERMVLVAGLLNVTYDGHDERNLRPGMYAYGPAGLGHSADCRSEDPCILFISFNVPVDAMPTH